MWIGKQIDASAVNDRWPTGTLMNGGHALIFAQIVGALMDRQRADHGTVGSCCACNIVGRPLCIGRAA
jgi:hypothetical protein